MERAYTATEIQRMINACVVLVGARGRIRNADYRLKYQEDYPLSIGDFAEGRAADERARTFMLGGATVEEVEEIADDRAQQVIGDRGQGWCWGDDGSVEAWWLQQRGKLEQRLVRPTL